MPREKRATAKMMTVFLVMLLLPLAPGRADTQEWSMSRDLSDSCASFSMPQIISFSGNLYVFWEDENGVPQLSSSSDGGISWSAPAAFLDYREKAYSPAVISTGDHMLFFWVNRGVGFSVAYSAWTSDGKNWNSMQIGTGDAQYSLPVALNGTDIVVLGARYTTKSYLYSSPDGGKSWNYLRPITNLPAKNSALLFRGDVMHIISSYDGMIRDYRSTDMGKSWNCSEIYNGSTEGRIWAGVHGGRMYVMWSALMGSNYQLMLSYSDDGGLNWTNGTEITYTSGNALDPDAVFDTEGNLYVVWEDNRKGNPDIFYMKLDSDGHRMVGDTWITESDTNIMPDLCFFNGSLGIAWNRVNDSVTRTYFSRYPDLIPQINDVTIKDTGLYTDITISADIRDDDSISIAAFNYTDVNGVSGVELMSSTGNWSNGGMQYSAELPPQQKEGNVSITIWAQDSRGNRAYSKTYTVRVGDTEAPKISVPFPAFQGERLKPVNVYAEVSDDHLASVRLYYLANRMGLKYVDMQQSGQRFVGSIPPQKTPTTLVYYIWANDTYGNQAKSRNYTLKIIDTIPPSIEKGPPPEIDPGQSFTIEFSESVDSESLKDSLVAVGFTYHLKWLNSSTVEIIPSGMKPGGTYTLIVSAGVRDSYGNEMRDTSSYQIKVKSNDTFSPYYFLISLALGLIFLLIIFYKIKNKKNENSPVKKKGWR